MLDQANKLRELTLSADVTPHEIAARVPMIVVTGARSGVGATTVAVNLAAVFADGGERVLVVDAAQHRSNLAEVAGIGRDFEYSVADVAAGKCALADAIVRGPVGLRVLANRSRVSPGRGSDFSPRRIFDRRNSPTVGESSRGAQQRLLVELESLRDQVDLIVVDAGCGLTAWTRRFWLRAQLVVLVTTTEDAALLDTYAAVKLSSTDAIQPMMEVVVNKAASDAAADDAQRRVENACRQFLSLSIEALPALPQHYDETHADMSRAPRVWEAPNSPFGHATLWLARAVRDALADETLSSCATACGEPNSFEFVPSTARCYDVGDLGKQAVPFEVGDRKHSPRVVAHKPF